MRMLVGMLILLLASCEKADNGAFMSYGFSVAGFIENDDGFSDLQVSYVSCVGPAFGKLYRGDIIEEWNGLFVPRRLHRREIEAYNGELVAAKAGARLRLAYREGGITGPARNVEIEAMPVTGGQFLCNRTS